jgi:hypothetical protein
MMAGGPFPGGGGKCAASVPAQLPSEIGKPCEPLIAHGARELGYSTPTRCVMPYERHRLSCNHIIGQIPVVYKRHPRNKPSFTPDAAESGKRVRPVQVPVSLWGRRMCAME